MNNPWFSKIAVWMVIAMVLFTVFKQFDSRGVAGAGYMGYSDFLEEVRANRIKSQQAGDESKKQGTDPLLPRRRARSGAISDVSLRAASQAASTNSHQLAPTGGIANHTSQRAGLEKRGASQSRVNAGEHSGRLSRAASDQTAARACGPPVRR